MYRSRLILVPVLALLVSFAGVGQSVLAHGGSSRSSVPPTKGTAQLPGDVGQVGVTYTLGTGDDAYNFTLRKFSFVASRLTLAGTVRYPDADKKFLVVDYTIRNPNSSAEFHAYSATFAMTAVDAVGQNYDLQGDAENTTTHQGLDISLKPGQSVDARLYLVVPAATPVPKLILNYGGPKVMRYDLHGVVSPVEPLLAEPSDKTGATAMGTISPAKIGVTYPCGQFDVTVEKFAFSDAPIGGTAPDDGKRYFIATMRIKSANNATTGDADIANGNGFTAFTMNGDGDKTDFNGTYYKASSDDAADTAISPGIEKRIRVVFQVSKSGGLKTATFSEGDAYRKLVYDVSGVQ